MPSVTLVREWRLGIVLGALSVGLLGAGEGWRLGMIGPESSADPGWVALQMGMREALAAYEQEGFEGRFVFPEVRRTGGLAGAVDQFVAQGVEAIVVMHPEAVALDSARLPAGQQFFWIEWAPPEAAGEIWRVDWGEWARAVRIVASDLAEAPGGVIGLHQLERVIPSAGREALRTSEVWPATGAWSMQSEPDLIETDLRRRTEVLVTADPRVLMSRPGPGRGTTVAVWLDALVLQSFVSKTVQAAVLPHWIEAGGAVIDRIMAGRQEAPSTAPASHRIGPLIVAPENAPHWRDFWIRWQF